MKTTGKVLLALTCGAAIGAALGVLFAPGKGSETRQKLSDSAMNLSDQILKMKDKFAATTASNGRSKVHDTVS